MGAYETKIIVASMAKMVLSAKTLKEAYDSIVDVASVEGFKLPSYEEAMKKQEEQHK